MVNFKAFEINEICQETEYVNVKEISKLFKDVKPEEIVRTTNKVELLIGSDFLNLHPAKSQSKGELVLYESMFGTGKILAGTHELIKSNNKFNAFAKIVANSSFRNVQAHRGPKGVDFFTSESFGISVPPKCNRCKSCKDCKFETQQLSLIEQKELQVIREGLKLNPVENKWETGYPYKADPKVLNKDNEDNRNQVISLMIKTENRLLKNLDAATKYNEQFEDFVSRGIFKEISSKEMQAYKGPVRYINHH